MVNVTKDHSVQFFKKVYFWAAMHRKGIQDIMGGQNEVKVTTGHKVHQIALSFFGVSSYKKTNIKKLESWWLASIIIAVSNKMNFQNHANVCKNNENLFVAVAM